MLSTPTTHAEPGRVAIASASFGQDSGAGGTPGHAEAWEMRATVKWWTTSPQPSAPPPWSWRAIGQLDSYPDATRENTLTPAGASPRAKSTPPVRSCAKSLITVSRATPWHPRVDTTDLTCHPGTPTPWSGHALACHQAQVIKARERAQVRRS